MDLGDYPNALKDYDRAIEIDVGLFNAYYGRGLVHKGMGDYEQALRELNSAFELNSDSYHVYYHRGLVYKDLGNNSRAIDDLNKALTLAQHPTHRADVERAIAEIQQ